MSVSPRTAALGIVITFCASLGLFAATMTIVTFGTDQPVWLFPAQWVGTTFACLYILLRKKK